MTVAVCIASHDRAKPLGIVLRCLPAAWHAVVVLSPGEDGTAYEQRPNTHVHYHANSPLGAKWQYAVNMARTLNTDVVGITGSDDVLQVDEVLLERAMLGFDFLGCRGFLAFDGREHYQCTYRPHVRMPIGGARFYRRELLDRMRWRLFDTTREKHLDEQGYANAIRHGARCTIADFHTGLRIIALKGDWPQKNPLDKYLRGRNLDVTLLQHVRHRIDYQF